ncbi:hypothetical protein [Methanooceanicella nereidis]|nr:hypothetical protein [Methanocella sp. CWC-04]
MEDLVPVISVISAIIGVIYFLIEFQFTGVRDRINASIRNAFRR